MSILIHGMEMPVCHFKTSESYNVHGFWMVYPDGKSKLHIMVDSDHWVCEAIPVPDHGRILKVLKTERECVSRDCDRDCGKCDLSLKREEIVSVYDTLIAMLDPSDKEG